MNSITDDSRSSRKPAGMESSPVVQAYFTCSKAPFGKVPWTYSQRQPRASRSERSGAPTPTAVTRALGNFLPRRPLIAAPASGRIGMSQSSSSMSGLLPLHQIQAVDVDGAPLAEDGDEEREPHRGLGGGDRHHEEDDQLTGVVPPLPRIGDQGEVGGVEHQLHREEDADAV